jgi:MFS transporter, PHS family, inorganic phosphate transporter
VKNVLKSIYSKEVFSSADATALSNSELVGAIIGQVVFGAIADKIGRKNTFIATISFVIIGCLASMSATAGLSMSLTAQLCLWRGIVGVGVGGEYPLSATVSAEGTTTASRGRALGMVFAMQGVGNVLSTLVMYILLLASPLPIDWVWRAALGIGALPGLLTLYGRLQVGSPF